LEPEKQKAPPNISPIIGGTRAQAYTAAPRVEPLPERKRKSWIVPWVAALCLAVVLGVGSVEYYSHQAPNLAPVAAQEIAQNSIILSGADVDEAATTQAIADTKADVNRPLVAPLTNQVKQEILSGERKFYCIPILNAPTNTFRPGDRVRIDFNNGLYGIYDLGKNPYTLIIPLKRGDSFTLTCLSVGQGKTALTVEVATDLSPVVSRPLSPGQSQSWSVTRGNEGNNYLWYEEEAEKGNATAEYGLGHMYQYGIGVPQELSQAVKWYRQAAAQGYADAKTQLSRLGY